MARPTKQGIDYFPLDTEFDDDLQLLIAEIGAEGLGIILTIWQAAYKSQGYYINYDAKLPLKIKQKCFSSVETIVNVVGKAIDFGIFDVNMYKTHHILTSRGIQKRYFVAARGKKQIEIIPQYILIDVSGVGNSINVGINGIVSAGNATNVKEEEEEEENVKENKKKGFLSDSIEYRLANYLYKHIIKNNPNFKQPNIQLWAKSIDLMIRLDKREEEEIKKIIQWCQLDEFWHKNILSASKLRKQYDALFLNMNNKTKEPNKPTDYDWRDSIKNQKSLEDMIS